MFFQRHRSFTRATLHGLTILGLVLAAGLNASPAHAAIINDNRANAIKITNITYSGSIPDIVPATTEATDPVISCGGSQGQDSVWWAFTPAKSGDVAINTTYSEYDTILALYKNNPLGGLTELACNDNAGGNTSALTMPLRGGVRYYIEVVRKTGTAVSAPDKLFLKYYFYEKVVGWGEPLGKKWDANDGVFTFSPGWSDYAVMGAYKGAIKISNNVNNTAISYFDGGRFDLIYALGPQMGFLEVSVDDVLQATIGQGSATYAANQVWSSPNYSDNVHKLTLRHGPSGTKANFDYIQVYSFPDVTAPGKINTLTAETGASTGKIILKWKAVGDDGNVGTAATYDLRYFVDTGVPPGCVADWASGTPYSGYMPAPAVAGVEQQVTLSGFAPGIKYHFCLAAVDEVGNVGAPSNRVTATAKAGTAYGTGTYDDAHAGWTYIGNWKLVNNPDARYNTQHNSSKIGDYASFYFTGTQFVLTYLTSPINGLMDVYIDGLYTTTIDQYTFYPNSFYYTSPILANGPHSLRLVHKTQVLVTVDQLYVWKTNDGGPPDPILDLAAAPGVNDGEVALTWTATGDDGAVGTAWRYEVRYSADPINNAVDWDYASSVAGVIPVPQPAGSPQTMTAVGLAPGAHYYFAVRVSDNAWYDILSNTVDSDVQYTGVYAGSGLYEDNHAIWQYIGGWRQINGGTAGHIHRSNNLLPNPSARFWFNGTKFRLTFQKDVNYGKLEVYVDGVKVGVINQANAATLWNQNWGSPVFAAGTHVIEFRVVGSKATIDAIRIWP